jgi:hypothetical protein
MEKDVSAAGFSNRPTAAVVCRVVTCIAGPLKLHLKHPSWSQICVGLRPLGAAKAIFRDAGFLARNLRLHIPMTRWFLLLPLALMACGDVPNSGTSQLGSASGAPDSLGIHGNIAPGGVEIEKVLVFAYASLDGKAAAARGTPTSLSAVATDRTFTLGSVPPGDATILFLIDTKSDGVIDPGDTVAVLDDVEHALSGLKAGDEVILQDVAIDAARGRATAAAIVVHRAAAPTEAAPLGE